ncbi:hypothetical protein BLA24_14910 [Streptomyces cinnamoneus]|uniref:Uncharacterized protein n=1 Tax=Streptomyces cinnamoneus TaxID=53446 RepID=A0A2G1XIL1_STRCJ|nr:hypothetical protein [Streptomyces cinnamoneus]PHQ51067.1 hypothetical protein BLA24_14910 [Streptomyces cinnamoneus]PPT13710.1 hypothetical protein CYQ11_13160 [Streptomyces cinnamoneus]
MFVFLLVLRLAHKLLRRLVRAGGAPGPAAAAGCAALAGREDFADRVRGDLADELPDEDIGQDLDDCLARYVLGSKPRCEEVEYLEMVQEAIDRIERGR